MEGLNKILARLGNTAITFDPDEMVKMKVDSFNKSPGSRHEDDGYNCKECNNKAVLAWVAKNEDGSLREAYSPCKCDEVRRSLIRMKASGLKNIIKDCTFDKFVVTESWQKAIKDAAMEYAKNPQGWFALLGQSGAGKTHLCTAICREFLLSGKRVTYMLWRDDIVKIKNAAQARDFDDKTIELRKLMDKFKTADVLYIDDLFKTGKDPKTGLVMKPTTADVNYAFEIINYRYNNPELLTIISSELTEDELLDIDEAIGGRIYQKAKSFSIAKDRSRNYRMRGAVTL